MFMEAYPGSNLKLGTLYLAKEDYYRVSATTQPPTVTIRTPNRPPPDNKQATIVREPSHMNPLVPPPGGVEWPTELYDPR